MPTKRGSILYCLNINSPKSSLPIAEAVADGLTLKQTIASTTSDLTPRSIERLYNQYTKLLELHKEELNDA